MANFIESLTLATILVSSSYVAGISLNGLNNSVNNKLNYSIIMNGLSLGYSITSFMIFSSYAFKHF